MLTFLATKTWFVFAGAHVQQKSAGKVRSQRCRLDRKSGGEPPFLALRHSDLIGQFTLECQHPLATASGSAKERRPIEGRRFCFCMDVIQGRCPWL